MTCDNLLLDLQNKDHNKDNFNIGMNEDLETSYILLSKIIQMYLLSQNKNHEQNITTIDSKYV